MQRRTVLGNHDKFITIYLFDTLLARSAQILNP